MAGDWIPMRTDLADDPAVIAMACSLSMDEFAVVGRLHRIWSWANRHLAVANAPSVSPAWVDRYLCSPGFASAMVAAKWLEIEDGSIVFPKFERWNSKGAKQRVLTAQRVAAHAARTNANTNGHPNGDSVSSALPKEEKRREEIREDPPNPPQPGGEAIPKNGKRKKTKSEPHPLFGRFWGAYPRKAAKEAASVAFSKIDPDENLLAKLLDALAWQSRLPDWTKESGKYAPHPASWLNGKRWEDERPGHNGFQPPLPTATGSPPPKFGTQPRYKDIAGGTA